MSLIYKERIGPHPVVQAVWHGEAHSVTPYWVPADGCWDIIFTQPAEGKTRAFLSGPMTRAKLVSQPAGTKLLGIRFKPGAFMPLFLPSNMIDQRVDLGSRHSGLWLEGISFEVPDYDNAEGFVSKLAQHDLVCFDTVVDDVLHDRRHDITRRTVQRHFAKAAGLSPGFINQIKRVQQAERLLGEGGTVTGTANLSGYADHAHMTRSFKRLLGRTPRELAGVR